MTKNVLLTILLLSFCLRDSGIQKHPHYDHDMMGGQGRMWLGWSAQQQKSFVFGYLWGYQLGFNSACLAYDEATPPKSGFSLNNRPLHKCKLQQLDFSKDVEYYAEQISTFYKRFPTDDDVPVSWLVQAFSDSEGKTLEEIDAAWSNHHAHP